MQDHGQKAFSQESDETISTESVAYWVFDVAPGSDRQEESRLSLPRLSIGRRFCLKDGSAAQLRAEVPLRRTVFRLAKEEFEPAQVLSLEKRVGFGGDACTNPISEKDWSRTGRVAQANRLSAGLPGPLPSR